jgi:hypothetical protein
MPVKVRCEADGKGYRCYVDISDSRSASHHLVRVSHQDFEHWARGRLPDELVRDSFDFLLARESKESILKDFDLSLIHRYFPEYDGA